MQGGAVKIGRATWLLGLLVALATLAARLRLAAGESPGAVAYWVADRDAGAVVGLDHQLFVARRYELPWPVRVLPWRGAGVVVASAAAGGPEGPHELIALDANGMCVQRWPCDPVIDLTVASDRLVAVVETGRGRALVEHSLHTGGTSPALGLGSSFTCCTFSGNRLFVGTRHGSVHIFDEDFQLEHVARPVEWVSDLEPGPQRGSVWVLDATSTGRLVCFGPGFGVCWSVALGFQPGVHELDINGPTIVSNETEECAWLIEPETRRLRCFGSDGVLACSVELATANGLARGAACGQSGLLLSGAGAIHQLGPGGRPALGQGGFDFVVDVCSQLDSRSRFSSP